MATVPPSKLRARRRLAGTAVGLAALLVAGSAAAGSHVVRPGETLSGIAQRYGVSTSSLVASNGLGDADRVQAGQRLSIPAGANGPGGVAVAPGESLWELAQRLGVSVSALAAANGIADPSHVVAGRTLVVPGGGSGAARGGGSAGTHVVAPGQTVWSVARRYGVSPSALAAANGLADPDRVRDGTRLTIPAGGGAAAPAASAPAASTSTSGLPSRLQRSPERLALLPTFDRWAAEYGVPADLLKAMTWLESGWQRGVVSSTGAVGVGQIMPDTETWMEDVLIGVPLDSSDPDDGIRMAARYLRWLLDRTGDTRTSLAGYYQGLRSVLERGPFDDTEAYVDNVLAFRDRF